MTDRVCGLGHSVPEGRFLCPVCGTGAPPLPSAVTASPGGSPVSPASPGHQEQAIVPERLAPMPPVLSPDGHWMWTGTEWIPVPPQTPPTSGVTSGMGRPDPSVREVDQANCANGHSVQALDLFCGTCAAPLSEKPQMSADGAWFWDRGGWQPVASSVGPGSAQAAVELRLPFKWDIAAQALTQQTQRVEPSADERANLLRCIASGHEKATPWRSHARTAEQSSPGAWTAPSGQAEGSRRSVPRLRFRVPETLRQYGVGAVLLAVGLLMLTPWWEYADVTLFGQTFYAEAASVHIYDQSVAGSAPRILALVAALVIGLGLLARHPAIGLPRLPLGDAALGTLGLVGTTALLVGGRAWADFGTSEGWTLTPSANANLAILLILIGAVAAIASLRSAPAGTPFLKR
jgi:hypothetical protein